MIMLLWWLAGAFERAFSSKKPRKASKGATTRRKGGTAPWCPGCKLFARDVCPECRLCITCCPFQYDHDKEDKEEAA